MKKIILYIIFIIFLIPVVSSSYNIFYDEFDNENFTIDGWTEYDPVIIEENVTGGIIRTDPSGSAGLSRNFTFIDWETDLWYMYTNVEKGGSVSYNRIELADSTLTNRIIMSLNQNTGNDLRITCAGSCTCGDNRLELPLDISPQGFNITYNNETKNITITRDDGQFVNSNIPGCDFSDYTLYLYMRDTQNKYFNYSLNTLNNVFQINLLYPENDKHYNDFTGYINITNPVNTTCDINDSRFNLVYDNGLNFSWYNNSLSDGDYYIKINCTNDELNFNFTIDTLNPIINLISPKNKSYLNSNFILNVTYSDTNLLFTNTTIFNISDDVKFNHENQSITTNLYNVTSLIDISSFNDGNFTIYMEAEDSHTFGDLRGLQAYTDYNYIEFYTPKISKRFYAGYYDGNNINILNREQVNNFDVDISFKELKGEYKFNMSFIKPLEDYKFGFITSKPEDLRLINPEIGHFVFKDWYIDFSDWFNTGFPINYKVTDNFLMIYTDTKYCNVKPGEKCILDPSIGGLNYVNSTSWFYIDTIKPTLNFISQNPLVISEFNILGYPLNISYEIFDNIKLNESSILLYYKINRTDNSPYIFINGTGINHYFNKTYNVKSGINYNFSLFDNQIYPASYNINERYLELTPYNIYNLDNLNEFIEIRFFNVSNKTQFGLFEIMINNTFDTGNKIANIYYCNSSYITGQIATSNFCSLFAQYIPQTEFNHSHNNYSKHQIFTFSPENGYINGIKVTEKSYFMIRGQSSTDAFNVYYINNNTNSVRTSQNNGLSWTNQPFTVNAHIHQYFPNDNLTYYVCTNDYAGNYNCSISESFEINQTNFPPEPPSIYIPESKNYFSGDLINISYRKAVSPTGNNISYYNISLLYNNLSFVETLKDNTSLLNYTWDTTDYKGNFIIRVTAYDNQSFKASGFSDNFTITYISEGELLLKEGLNITICNELYKNNSLGYFLQNDYCEGDKMLSSFLILIMVLIWISIFIASLAYRNSVILMFTGIYGSFIGIFIWNLSNVSKFAMAVFVGLNMFLTVVAYIMYKD